jgi:hypothetical protein
MLNRKITRLLLLPYASFFELSYYYHVLSTENPIAISLLAARQSGENI